MNKKKLIGIIVACIIVVLTIVVIASPTPTTKAPAEFVVSNLDVSPEEVEPGETVVVTVEVQNIGEQEGTHELELIIDELVEQSESVTLGGGQSTTITFTVQKETRKSYSTEVDGLSKSFEVVASAQFAVSDLTISPTKVEPGDEIEISALVVNVGDLQGTKSLELMVNGESTTVEVSLGPGENTTVAFTLTQEIEGTYEVWLEGLSGSFKVFRPTTKAGGIIHKDTTWTLADSPYEITETVQIPSEVTLTMEPGVTIINSSGDDMFLLMGTIYAHGTSQEPIVMDGGGSRIIYTQPGYGYGDFRYCIIQNGREFWNRWGHLDLRYSKLVNLGTSGDWSRSIIKLDNPSGETNIEFNRFVNTAGISSYSDQYGTNVRYNLFRGLLSPLAHMGGGTPSSPPKEMIVKYNSFVDTKGLALYLASGFTGWAPSIDATENYWGTFDTNIIDQMIYDRNDDIRIDNYIHYLPILTEPHPDTPSP